MSPTIREAAGISSLHSKKHIHVARQRPLELISIGLNHPVVRGCSGIEVFFVDRMSGSHIRDMRISLFAHAGWTGRKER
jgi:DUF2075 family protein